MILVASCGIDQSGEEVERPTKEGKRCHFAPALQGAE